MPVKTAAREDGRRLFCYGRWKRRIDSKRRIRLPSEFRFGFGEEAVIVERDDLNGFSVYPIEKIDQFNDPSQLWLVDIDSHGRFVLPLVVSFSRPEVIWLGKGDHFEVAFEQ